MWSGVLMWISYEFTSAWNLIKSSTFLIYLKITAKCKGVAFNPLLTLTSKLKFCLLSYSSFKTKRDR